MKRETIESVISEIAVALMVISICACGLVIGAVVLKAGAYLGGLLLVLSLFYVVLETLKNTVTKVRDLVIHS